MAYYSWILAFHVVSVLSWMAMLFYLPRLFVYHREHNDKVQFVEVVKIQEYKLYKYIGLPALWATVISGLFLLWLNPYLLQSGTWIYIKLFLVFLLVMYSFSLDYFRRVLANDRHALSGKFFRLYNEVPTLLGIGIVIMVIVKPF
ncbi:MAG: protoporphyrinogen oxidase HemJ [Sulfurovaceae bacterium]|nr:protoporphyrinogen oxidase HemJ [Sulfurovaceae bacterium]